MGQFLKVSSSGSVAQEGSSFAITQRRASTSTRRARPGTPAPRSSCSSWSDDCEEKTVKDGRLVYGRTVSESGELGPEVRLGGTSLWQTGAAVADSGGGGRFLVAWGDYDLTPGIDAGYRARLVDAQGQPVVGPVIDLGALRRPHLRSGQHRVGQRRTGLAGGVDEAREDLRQLGSSRREGDPREPDAGRARGGRRRSAPLVGAPKQELRAHVPRLEDRERIPARARRRRDARGADQGREPQDADPWDVLAPRGHSALLRRGSWCFRASTMPSRRRARSRARSPACAAKSAPCPLGSRTRRPGSGEQGVREGHGAVDRVAAILSRLGAAIFARRMEQRPPTWRALGWFAGAALMASACTGATAPGSRPSPPHPGVASASALPKTNAAVGRCKPAPDSTKARHHGGATANSAAPRSRAHRSRGSAHCADPLGARGRRDGADRRHQGERRGRCSPGGHVDCRRRAAHASDSLALRTDARGLRRRDRRRPVDETAGAGGRADHLRAAGESLLLLPAALDETAISVSLSIDGESIYASATASSFGVGAVKDWLLRGRALRHASFLAGQLGTAVFRGLEGDDDAAWIRATRPSTRARRLLRPRCCAARSRPSSETDSRHPSRC